MANREVDLDALTAEEQLDLLDRLWERLGRGPDHFPLTEPQRREIDARSEELDRALAAGVPGGIHGTRSSGASRRMSRVLLQPAAATELDDAYSWSERERAGLGGAGLKQRRLSSPAQLISVLGEPTEAPET